MHLKRPLARFFRPPPPSPPTLEVQVAALEHGSPEALIATILGEGPDALRAAAVRALPDGLTLRQLAGLNEGTLPSAPSLQRIAQERVAQLIDAGSIDFAELCSAAAGRDQALLSVAGLCGDPARVPQAFASIDDPQRVSELVIQGSSTRVRQLAAHRIEDPAQLRQLLTQVRGKDKNVYKIIKHKLDVSRDEQQRIARVENDVNALCLSLERHGHRVHDVLYPTSLKLLCEQWQTLEPQAAPELRDRARRAIDRCQDVIAGHSRLLAQQATEQSDRAALQAARERAATLAAEEAQRRSEAAASAAAEAATIRAAEEKARAEQAAAEALASRQLGGLIAKAHSALREGTTGRAAGLRRAVEEKLSRMPGVPAHLATQVQQLDAKLDELKEWKNYAVAPKRAELIEEMTALIGSSEEPKALAERIKQLREEWRTISKGIVSDSEADWQRFNQAAVTAYQPCLEYFEAQAKLRQTNAEKRTGVLERLRAFEIAQGGEHPDWRAVTRVLREARQEWRDYFPVERATSLAAQEEFDALLGRLQGRLDAWHAQNAADKKTLIQRAHQLLAKEDGREAVDAVKSLQAQWKEVGPARRDQEQPLWEEFREQCDAVYRKRHQAQADYTAALEVNKQQAVALCEQAEQVAALSGSALLEGAAKMTQWRAALEGLGGMPQADERRLRDRFERAVSLCQARVSQQRAHEKQRSFTNLLEAARRIQAYGWAAAQGGPLAAREELKQSAETFIAGIQHWPKGGADALQAAWTSAQCCLDASAHGADRAAQGMDASAHGADRAAQGMDASAHGVDAAAHEAALRMLCIRSEILTDEPTPPADQALRRAYQVQRLVQHMGQGREAGADELDALALEWVRIGPVSPAVYEALLARFLGCRCRTGR
ncbi:MAG: DUF349 domain-containing protein [Pseudomonadota bacterium]|nr:DUF349 domain-containing protein [Pseudomonadota bacterium]